MDQLVKSVPVFADEFSDSNRDNDYQHGDFQIYVDNSMMVTYEYENDESDEDEDREIGHNEVSEVPEPIYFPQHKPTPVLFEEKMTNPIKEINIENEENKRNEDISPRRKKKRGSRKTDEESYVYESEEKSDDEDDHYDETDDDSFVYEKPKVDEVSYTYESEGKTDDEDEYYYGGEDGDDGKLIEEEYEDGEEALEDEIGTSKSKKMSYKQILLKFFTTKHAEEFGEWDYYERNDVLEWAKENGYGDLKSQTVQAGLQYLAQLGAIRRVVLGGYILKTRSDGTLKRKVQRIVKSIESEREPKEKVVKLGKSKVTAKKKRRGKVPAPKKKRGGWRERSKKKIWTRRSSNWSKEEDDKLLAIVRKRGSKKWRIIAERIRGKNGNQCRNRFLNHLDPSINREAFTPAEDRMIISKQARYGSSIRWAKMAKEMEGRTAYMIKNRWHSSLCHVVAERRAVVEAAGEEKETIVNVLLEFYMEIHERKFGNEDYERGFGSEEFLKWLERKYSYERSSRSAEVVSSSLNEMSRAQVPVIRRGKTSPVLGDLCYVLNSEDDGKLSEEVANRIKKIQNAEDEVRKSKRKKRKRSRSRRGKKEKQLPKKRQKMQSVTATMQFFNIDE